MNDKHCATCKWHPRKNVDDGLCVNSKSDYCCDWTDDDFVCGKWEAED